MKRVSKFLCLPVKNQRFLIKTMLLVWVIRLGLWLIPFRTMRNMVARMAEHPPRSGNMGWPSPYQIARAITIVSCYLPMATCLSQALATQVLLGRYGHPAELHIGVARSAAGEFQAHAWVESDGVVVIGGSKSELECYIPLLAFEGKG